jgi:hypothetical protein
LYALVENGVISPVSQLPQNWMNVSNLPALDAQGLASLGWYSVTDPGMPTYDAATQIVDIGYTFTPEVGVTKNYTVRSATADEIAAHQKAQADAAAAAAAAAATALKAQAQAALTKSDVTMIRCVENQVQVPAEWAAYRRALRAIISTGTGTMPTQPAFPRGT